MKINFINKRNIIFLLFFFIIFFILKENTFAADGDTTEMGSLIVSVVQGFLQIVSSLIGLVTALVSLFLYPGWVNGEIFSLDIYLRDIWILVSNIVYYIFAFILIFIAFMNIVGGEAAQKYELKQSLPKFIIGVLMVPFSWFFVQFVLSVSSFLTVAVLTIPFNTFQGYDFFENLEDNSEKICVDYTINLGEVPEGEEEDGFFKCEDEEGGLTIYELLNGTDGEGEGDGEGLKNSIFGIVSIYTYGVISVEGLDTIAKNDLSVEGGISSLFSLGVKVIFDIIFVAMYLILLVALFLALFVRATYLWLYTMLSPVFGLLFFFGKSKEGVGGSDKKFSITGFISLAMVPVLASAALSFGLMLIFIVGHGLSETQTHEDDTISIGGFTLTIEGSHGTYEGALSTAIGGIQSTIGQIILELFGLAILWIAVISALNSSSVTRAVVEPIAQFGKSVGTLVAKSPTYMPIPGTGGMSARGLQQAGSTFQSSFEQRAAAKGGEFAQNLSPDASSVASANNLLTQLKSEDFNPRSVSQFRKTMDDIGTVSAMSSNQAFKDSVKEMARLLGLQDNEYIKDKSLNNPTDMLRALNIIDGALDRDKSGRYGTILDKGNSSMNPRNYDITTMDAELARRKTGTATPPTGTPPAAGTTTKTTSIGSVGGITINENGSDTIIQTGAKTRQLAESFEGQDDAYILSILNSASITEKAEIDQSLANILNSGQELYSDGNDFSKTQKPGYNKVISITFDETNRELIVTK